MALPSLKSTAPTQLSERRHTDPPRLWTKVILGSVVIHILLFGILRFLWLERLQGFLSEAILIPVDVISLTPGTTSPVSGNQLAINPPSKKPSTRTINRQPASSATQPQRQTNSQEILTQDSNNNQVPVTSPNIRQNRPSNSSIKPTSSNTSPNPSPNVPERGSPNTSPNPSPNVPEQGSPNTSPNPSPSVPTETGSPNPQQGSGFVATPGQFNVANNEVEFIDPSKNGDAFATLAPGNKQSFSGEELRSLGIKLDQVQALQVLVLIETTGQATVESTQVQQGNLSPNTAQQLAKFIVEQWTFSPTKMQGGVVPRYYNLNLTITPARN